MRAAVILTVFGTALWACWDDDAPRLGASLACDTLSHRARCEAHLTVSRTRGTGALSSDFEVVFKMKQR